MRNLWMALAAALALAVPIAGCDGSSKKESTTTTSAKKYECPMKCVPPSDRPGECSKCGMNLVESR